MTKLSNLRTSEEVLAGALRDPAFRAEWERTAVARALAPMSTRCGLWKIVAVPDARPRSFFAAAPHQ